jgi:regulatory protein
MRARTERQVRARLEKDEFEPALVEEVVAWLRGLKYLDDAVYARGKARDLVLRDRVGPRLAVRRLAGSGIDAADAEREVAGAVSEQGEEALARIALSRRTKGATPEEPRERARLARWLIGRGFSPPVVAKVLGMWRDGDE